MMANVGQGTAQAVRVSGVDECLRAHHPSAASQGRGGVNPLHSLVGNRLLRTL